MPGGSQVKDRGKTRRDFRSVDPCLVDTRDPKPRGHQAACIYMLRSLGCSEWSLHPKGLLWASSGQERLVAWPLCLLRGTGEVILNAAAVGSERDLSVTGVGETPRSEPEDAGWACSRAATRLRACPEVCTLAGSPHLRLFHLGTKAAGLRHCVRARHAPLVACLRLVLCKSPSSLFCTCVLHQQLVWL